MERTIAWFDRFDLFQSKSGNPERPATATLASVATRIDEWYDSFWDISMKYCDGNVEAAERFMDTNVFMFYYRIKQKAAYIHWHNERMKNTHGYSS